MRRWLTAFPSYGFVLSVSPANTAVGLERFAARGLSAAVVGEVNSGSAVSLRSGADETPLWDFAARPFITAGARA